MQLADPRHSEAYDSAELCNATIPDRIPLARLAEPADIAGAEANPVPPAARYLAGIPLPFYAAGRGR